ncbi:hypothetical protein [Chlorogloeopsis sp. ULAP02]
MKMAVILKHINITDANGLTTAEKATLITLRLNGYADSIPSNYFWDDTGN